MSTVKIMVNFLHSSTFSCQKAHRQENTYCRKSKKWAVQQI